MTQQRGLPRLTTLVSMSSPNRRPESLSQLRLEDIHPIGTEQERRAWRDPNPRRDHRRDRRGSRLVAVANRQIRILVRIRVITILVRTTLIAARSRMRLQISKDDCVDVEQWKYYSIHFHPVRQREYVGRFLREGFPGYQDPVVGQTR